MLFTGFGHTDESAPTFFYRKTSQVFLVLLTRFEPPVIEYPVTQAALYNILFRLSVAALYSQLCLHTPALPQWGTADAEIKITPTPTPGGSPGLLQVPSS